MSTRTRGLILLTALTLPACYAKDPPRDGAAMGTDTDAGTGGDDGADGGDDGADETGGGSEGGDDTGGAPADGGDEGGSTTGDAELEALIGSLCEWDFACCSAGELDFRLGPFTVDASDCTERFVQQLHSNDNDNVESPRGDLLYTLGYAVRLDRSTPDAETVEACRQLLDQRGCNEPPGDLQVSCSPADDPAENPCDMRNLFTGKQAVGEPCSEALASLGFDIECQAGASCEQLDGVFVCVDKGLVDDFCESDSTCDQGLFCDLSAGRCAERRDVGQPCAFEDSEAPDAGSESLPCLEHLSCDPGSDTCVAYCSTGYDCVVDEQCPDSQSCTPVDIGDGVYTYCGPRGDTNGDRCDTDHDCADAMHCAGGACAMDIAQGQPCAATHECQAGLYCGGTCEIVLNNGQACVADLQCNPSTTVGCVTSDDGRVCRNGLLANADACVPGEREGGANWCSSGICEDLTDDLVANPVCQPGAGEGDDCDESDATIDMPRCADGLYCQDDVCKSESGAGGTCEDDGAQQCSNGLCTAIWDSEYCTDAPPLGAADVTTCDGQR